MYIEPEMNDYNQNSRDNMYVQSWKSDSQEAGDLTVAERTKLLNNLGNWEYKDEGYLQRVWRFDDFQTAIDWLNRAWSICCARIGHRAQLTLGLGHNGTVIEAKVLLGLSRADGELATRLELEGQGQSLRQVTLMALPSAVV